MFRTILAILHLSMRGGLKGCAPPFQSLNNIGTIDRTGGGISYKTPHTRFFDFQINRIDEIHLSDYFPYVYVYMWYIIKYVLYNLY